MLLSSWSIDRRHSLSCDFVLSGCVYLSSSLPSLSLSIIVLRQHYAACNCQNRETESSMCLLAEKMWSFSSLHLQVLLFVREKVDFTTLDGSLSRGGSRHHWEKNSSIHRANLASVLCRDFICRSITLVERKRALSGQLESRGEKSFPFCNQLALAEKNEWSRWEISFIESGLSLADQAESSGWTRDFLSTRVPDSSMTSTGCPKQNLNQQSSAQWNWCEEEKARSDLSLASSASFIFLWQMNNASHLVLPVKPNLASLPSCRRRRVFLATFTYSISLFQWSETERSNRQQFNKLRTDRRRVAIHLHDNSIKYFKWASPDSFAYENLGRSSVGVDQFSLFRRLCISGKETKRKGAIITSVNDNKCILIMRSLWLVKTK